MQSYCAFNNNSTENIAKKNGWELQSKPEETPTHVPFDQATRLQESLDLPPGWHVSGFFERENTIYATVEPYNAL